MLIHLAIAKPAFLDDFPTNGGKAAPVGQIKNTQRRAAYLARKRLTPLGVTPRTEVVRRPKLNLHQTRQKSLAGLA